VDSELGKGAHSDSRFHIKRGNRVIEQFGPSDEYGVNHGKRKFAILVIDDDPADAEILRRLLDEIEGGRSRFWSVTTSNGTCGSPALQVDLIFLDYLLGAETGLEVFREIRKEAAPTGDYANRPWYEEVAVEP